MYYIYLAERVNLTPDPETSCTAISEHGPSYSCNKAYDGVVEPTGSSEWTAKYRIVEQWIQV